jgi:hypothetical protein
MKEKSPKCYKCGSAMQSVNLAQHLVTTRDGRAIVCQDVPIHLCPNDGEVYFSSSISQLFDQIRQGKLMPNDVAVIELPAVSMPQVLTTPAVDVASS